MGSDARTGTGEMPAIPEDTVDLGERLDPVRTLLRRISVGDQRAAAALVDVLGPRIHGLAVHVTGSSARAGTLTVTVLRSCLRDASELSTSGLPGEAAILDRARRAAVATRPSGDVRSLAGPTMVEDRTSDRREMDVLRVLLELPPAERALVESAAQGRFVYSGQLRQQAAVALSRTLDRLVPFGGPDQVETRALASLDALALADAGERLRLRELTRAPETASIHRHAIEAAARLALLTAVPPSRDLRVAVLEGFGASSPARQPLRPVTGAGTPIVGSAPAAAPAAAPPAPEPQYGGDYATPVLGTDTQRRMVGPPARTGGRFESAAEPPLGSPMTPSSEHAPPRGADGTAAAPAFAFRPTDEKVRSRQGRRREKRRTKQSARAERTGQAGPTRFGAPWLSRALAVLALVVALVLGVLLVGAERQLTASESFSDTWMEHSMDPKGTRVLGLSDNGTWQAVIAEDGLALRATGVEGWKGEVLELWGVTDGVQQSLGVLELSADGTIEFSTTETADRLFVTREMEPGNESGSPSSRVVANLDPSLTGIGG